MVSIEKTLENVFDKPLRKLTEHQRKFVFHYIKDWAIMSSEQRRAKATEADRQFQNKERLKSTRYIKPLTEEELEQYSAGWNDATLEANHWFSQSMVSPTNAAMLLCQHNPNEISFDDAVQLLPKHKGHGIIFDPKESHSKYRSLPTTGPQQLVQLQQRFNELNTTAPADRSLRDWLEYARSQNIEYNSWIDKYTGAISRPVSEADPVQIEAEAKSEAVKIDDGTPPPLTTGDIAHIFQEIRWTETQWKKPLADIPKWLEACIAIRGARGVRETRWNPVLIGDALIKKGYASNYKIRNLFKNNHQLKPWFETWQSYEYEYLNNE